MEALAITLEPERVVYCPGQRVQGTVLVTVVVATRCSEIVAVCRGKAYLEWVQHSGATTIIYTNKENYTKQSIQLWHPTSGQEVISPGQHSFTFQFDLPAGGLPSSFEGSCGYVRYFIKVEAVLPRRCNKKAKKYFSLDEVYDLNHISEAKDPIDAESEGSSCCGCLKKGPIRASFSLPARGVRVGGTLTTAIRVHNASSSLVKNVTVSLQQHVVYRADCSCLTVIKEVSRSVVKVKLGELPRDSEKEYNVTLEVPGIVSSLQHCNIMTLQYRLQVKAEFGRLRSATVKCPVTVIVGSPPLTDVSGPQPSSPDEGMQMEPLLAGISQDAPSLPCYYCTVKKAVRISKVDFSPNYLCVGSDSIPGDRPQQANIGWMVDQ